MAGSIILIGPTSFRSTRRVGGVTLPFEEFVAWCCKQPDLIDIDVHRLTGGSKLAILWSHIRAATALLKVRKHEIVSLHLTWNALLFFAPFIILAYLLSNKKVNIRKFAGNFDQYFERSAPATRILLLRTLRSCRIVYFETNYLVRWARQYNINAMWWPNSRIPPIAGLTQERSSAATPPTFLFVGSISKAKGVLKLVTLALANPEIEIRVFGPPGPDGSVDDLLRSRPSNLQYKGELSRANLHDEMLRATALLLPSSWEAEGYPGVIIEAAFAGTPTICSNSRGPAELVEQLGYGWVIDFDNAEQCSTTLRSVTSAVTDTFRSNLVAAAARFHSTDVFQGRLSEMDDFNA